MNWVKILRRTVLAIAILLIAAIVAAVVFVHTAKFHSLVVSEIERRANAATGGRLTIAFVAIDWSRLTLDVFGLTLHGKESDSQPPLFAADRLRVGLKIVSLLRRKIDLDEIVLDRPIGHLDFDLNGNSNLPQPPPHKSSGSTWDRIIDLAIQHVQIDSGQFYCNDREIPLSAEVANLHAQIDFNRLASEYRGDVAYDPGQFTMKDFKPIAHGLHVKFAAGRSGVVADPIVVTTGQSNLTAHAKLENFRDPEITGTYEGTVSSTEVGRVLKNDSVPNGKAALSGGFSYHDVANQSWLECVHVDGRMSSGQLRESLGRKTAIAKSVTAQYQLQDGNLSVQKIAADMLGGRVTGNYKLDHLTGNSISRLDAIVRNVSLEQLNDTAATPSLESVRLRGLVDGTVGGSWGSSFRDGVLEVHTTIRNPNPSAAGPTIPLNGVINLKYNGAQNVASFSQSYLKTGNTTAVVMGTLSKRSQLNTEVTTSDLHELGELIASFESRSSAAGNSATLSGLGGSAQFKGQILGSISDPRIQGALSANNLVVQKTRWRSLQVILDAASTGITLRNGVLDDTQKAQIAFNGHADLRDWSFGPTNPLFLQLNTRQFSIAQLQQFTNLNYPITGILAANVSISGSEENPAGQGMIQVTRASFWNQPITNLSADFKGDGNSIHSDAKLTASAGTITAALTYSAKMQSFEAAVQTSELHLDQLEEPQLRTLGVRGNLTLSAMGHGTLDNPQLTAELQIPQLQVRDQVISDVQAQLNVANQHGEFVLNSKADQGQIQAKGDVDLRGEYPATASLDVRSIPVGAILASYLHASPDIHGEAELHATLTGPLKHPAAITAKVEVPSLSVMYQSTSLALVRPLDVNYENGVATIVDGEFKGSGTDFSVKGTIPVQSAAPFNVSANGTVDLSILHGFSPDISSSGRIDLNVSAHGELEHPTMQGDVHFVNATFSSEDIPVAFEGINGLIQVAGNRIEIAQFSGSAGGGTVSAHGFMTYGEPSNFNVGLDLNSVRLRYPEGVRSLLTGNLALTGTAAASLLSGRVLIDRISLTQEFDLSSVLGQFSAATPSTSSSPVEHNMKLNVSVATAQDVNLENNKLSIAGSANLTLGGTLVDPVVLGRTTLTSGQMFFLGKLYQIQSGTIDFANPVQTTPVLNLYATTTVQQYNITLNFIGPADRLRTNYTSDPPLPPADIINLIAFGETAEQQATSPSTSPTLGAESVLAQGAASEFSGKIEKLTGISQLTIDPLASNSGTDTASTLAIQQRVTGNVLLTFTTDITSTENQSIQVQYQIKKDLSISVLRDEYGGYAAAVRIHKSF